MILLTYLATFFTPLLVGLIYAVHREERVRRLCVQKLRKEAEQLYEIEKKKPGTALANSARAAAHSYSSAAMMLEEMEL